MITKDTMDHVGPTKAFREDSGKRLSTLSHVQDLLSRAEVVPIMAGLVRQEFDAV